MKSLKLNFSQFNRNKLIVYCQNEIKTSTEQWQLDIYTFILEWLNEDKLVKAKTSGSTGTPKIILLDKARMIESAKMTGEFFKFNKNDKALLCLSPQFIAGKMMIVRAIVWQMNLICVKPDGHPIDALDSEIDFAAMIPLQVSNSIQYKDQLAKVKTILIGGGVIYKNLEKQLNTMSTNFFSSFGMTETLSHVAIKTLNGPNKSDTYKALNGISLTTDERGCLKIKAQNLLNKEITTNDIVNLISSSEFKWLGRYDHVINSAGIKLFPEIIEEKLSPHIKEPFFLIGIPDEHLGEKMILLIESKTNSEEQKKKISAKIGPYLEKFQFPREIIILTKFKRTLTGKIQRKASLEGFTEKK